MNTLKVPGATLQYEVRGSGPVLLLVTGGPADSSVYTPMVSQLMDRYTLVTYNTRGVATSEPDDRDLDVSIPILADDAHYLLSAVLNAGDTAFVFGNSGGATTAVDLLTRYPDQLRKVVAHEPPLTGLLPDADDYRAQGEEIYQTLQTQGVGPAMGKFLAMVGVESPPPSNPNAAPSPEQHAQMAAFQRTAQFFLAHYLRQVNSYIPEFGRVPVDKLVVAVGETSAGQTANRSGRALAKCLGIEPTLFPSDHGGMMSCAVEFAARLDAVLRAD